MSESRLTSRTVNDLSVRLSHPEITLLLFALEGGHAATVPDPSSCEEACPIVETAEELLCGGTIEPRKQLVRHLNNHLRDALMESGMFELMASANGQPGAPAGNPEKSDLLEANERLHGWSSEIRFDPDERKLLLDALKRMPRSAWLMMPRTMWTLKRKLKTKSQEVTKK